jgi:murein DD-endopeptidase MepM/ murein hydrolase activator NlpD
MSRNSNLPKQAINFSFLSLFFLVFTVSPAEAIRWPFNPGNVSLPLGNNYGEYQYYGGDPYFHPGIDILQPYGTHVYAVKSGIVKAVLTTSGQYHWRVAIGGSAGSGWCDGWLYAHLDQPTIQVQVGDSVQEGDYLGNLVYWPVADFHHLHFVKIRDQGSTWPADWQFIANPLDELVPIDEPDPPVIENARGSDKFAFCQNNTHTYFNPGGSLSGDVDIISKIYDKINHSYWRLIPYKIEYSLLGSECRRGISGG